MTQWPHTSFAKKLGIPLPLIQAPMAGGITTPELVAAVSNAGGIGSLGAALMQPEEIRKAVKQIKTLTSHPFSVNLFISVEKRTASSDVFLKRLQSYEKEFSFQIPGKDALALSPPSFEMQLEVLLEEKIPIFSFTFGAIPEAMVRELQKKQILVMGTATHLSEAVLLEKTGVDFIVCQGKEAGGHRGTFLGSFKEGLIPTFELVREIRSHVSKSLIAAGGITSGETIRLALQAGADAVQIGTLFLTCHESGASSVYKKALLEWKDHPTILTRAFTGRWARSIANRFACDLAPWEGDIPPYPITQTLTGPMRKAAASAGLPHFLSLWAGEGFRFCRDFSAADLISQLDAEARM